MVLRTKSGEISPTTRLQLVRDLAASANATRASGVAKFFKTGPGEYGEGDQFLGIPVPLQRKIAMRYRALTLRDIASLLASPIHEHRFAALEILVAQYEDAAETRREEIVDFYLGHTRGINNWDLVDTSAPYILGEHLKSRPRRILLTLARSKSVWERRIAIVATFALIRNGETTDTFRIAEKLFADKHDLVQKAVGWMLRETGKISQPALRSFLSQHYSSIPRTTLRYAIERFTPQERKRMLSGDFQLRH